MKRNIYVILAIFMAVVLSILASTIVLGISIFLVVYMFIMQPFEVTGNAMYPTYPNGAYVLTQKSAYKKDTPKRGDIIVYEGNRDGVEIFMIHRVVGIQGDKIKISDGDLYINGIKVNEEYLDSVNSTYGGEYMSEDEEITVPENHVFVLGDNREDSMDSRKTGFVPIKAVTGKVVFCYAFCDER